ncbi:MAG: hypothetical protein WC662_02285 [Candidatus Paceibacterota bacterium]|jgi:hypothetical protein
MVNEHLINEIEKFLSKNFSFVKFEIYNFFNNNKIYWAHSKAMIFQDMEYTDKDAFKMIDTIKSKNWAVYDEKSTLKYIASEFKLFSHINSNHKYKVDDIKVVIKSILDSEKLVQTIKFNPLISDLIKEGRHRVKNVYPNEIKSRQNISAEIGDKVYFCDSSNNIANPAYVIGNFADEKLHIAYFTNLNSDYIETQNLNINGWALIGAYKNEVGLTPEQAIKNRMN